jgi:hypothetical protein
MAFSVFKTCEQLAMEEKGILKTKERKEKNKTKLHGTLRMKRKKCVKAEMSVKINLDT